ncbi:MAG TPA: hypothetical protein GX707_10060 [Epulopiscium sp.]|nr:hypothetical protein [Candidatus Epulonipiscium sp.]
MKRKVMRYTCIYYCDSCGKELSSTFQISTLANNIRLHFCHDENCRKTYFKQLKERSKQ